eukprot:jgi/Mesen1/4607/ME000233S03901
MGGAGPREEHILALTGEVERLQAEVQQQSRALAAAKEDHESILLRWTEALTLLGQLSAEKHGLQKRVVTLEVQLKGALASLQAQEEQVPSPPPSSSLLLASPSASQLPSAEENHSKGILQRAALTSVVSRAPKVGADVDKHILSGPSLDTALTSTSGQCGAEVDAAPHPPLSSFTSTEGTCRGDASTSVAAAAAGAAGGRARVLVDERGTERVEEDGPWTRFFWALLPSLSHKGEPLPTRKGLPPKRGGHDVADWLLELHASGNGNGV